MFIHYTAQNLLFAELLHKLVYIDDAPYILFPILSVALIYLISKKIFKGFWVMIPPLIFLISPWGWYLALSHSFYVFLFFLTLVVIYGVILVKSGRPLGGNILIAVAGLITMYSSTLFFILIPLSITVLIILKIVNYKQLIISILFIGMATLPLLLLVSKNKSEFQNNLRRETMSFSDPSVVNTANRYQGNAAEAGFKNLARISENKYIFYVESVTLKYVTLINPVAFFTPEYRLLGFSFSPPILLGFIIPFGYGLYKLLQKPESRKILFISTLLVIPSITANIQVPLNRLILFSPVIIFVITSGLIGFINLKGNKTAKFFLITTIILILLQTVVIFSDLRFREKDRFERYFGNNYEIYEP
jgi:hypothetical protein